MFRAYKFGKVILSNREFSIVECNMALTCTQCSGRMIKGQLARLEAHPIGFLTLSYCQPCTFNSLDCETATKVRDLASKFRPKVLEL